MKNIKKILILICFVFVIGIFANISYAAIATPDGTSGNWTGGSTNKSFIDTILSKGNSWFQGAQNGDTSLATKLTDMIMNDFTSTIKAIGNLIFLVVGVSLGIKYIWSSIDGKAQIKESLINYVVAIIMFYLATNVYDFATNIFSQVSSEDTLNKVIANIWVTFVPIAQILSLTGLMAIGLKYMYSTAQNRADIKKELFGVVIGLVLVFAISSVIKFVIKTGKDTLKSERIQQNIEKNIV